MKLGVSILLSALLCEALTGAVQAADSSTACTAQEYRNFDFWVGNWDVFNDKDGLPSAHVHVSSILNGCGVREQYAGLDGTTGESLSTYDLAHRVWKQYWMSSTGEIVFITGGFSSGAMVLTGPETGSQTSLVRGTWKPEATGVREVGERSRDEGRTWGPWFDLHFRRSLKKPGG